MKGEGGHEGTGAAVRGKEWPRGGKNSHEGKGVAVQGERWS